MTADKNESWEDMIERIRENMLNHVEEFACAFAKKTQLPPDKIVMVTTTEWRDGKLLNMVWFEEKKTL